jgi:nitrate reductase (cytochrome), electron transfer subunit
MKTRMGFMALLAALPLSLLAVEGVDSLRRGAALDAEGPPPVMAKVEDRSLRRERAYPMQPPTIPHAIDGYQVDLNSNRCMLCHSRANAEQFQAPMVSVTHYMDRDGQFLAEISPRRYFCDQCHVVQTDARPLVENTFVDVDTLLQQEAAARRGER